MKSLKRKQKKPRLKLKVSWNFFNKEHFIFIYFVGVGGRMAQYTQKSEDTVYDWIQKLDSVGFPTNF